jgi:chemotaxis protein methyltransferase CheR
VFSAREKGAFRLTLPMKGPALSQFLAAALPRLGLSPLSFSRVQNIVGKRLARRLRELALPDLVAYAAHLEQHADEWAWLAQSCRIPISRFYRDREVFDHLIQMALPDLARRARAANRLGLNAWSAGCASGEEVFTLAIAWRLSLAPLYSDLSLSLVASDADRALLERAQTGVYPLGNLRELPRAWQARAFAIEGELRRLSPEFHEGVVFRCEDIRSSMPDGPFDLVTCRNLAFSYFDADAQRDIANALLERLLPGGYLLVGLRERVPDTATVGLRLVGPCLYQKDGRERTADRERRTESGMAPRPGPMDRRGPRC